MRAPGANRGWMLVAPALTSLGWAGNHVTPLLPLYRQQHGLTYLQSDLMLGMQVAGIVPGFIVATAVTRRVGVRRALLAAVLLSTLGSLVLSTQAGSVVGLCLGRLLVGVSSGVGMVAGSAWLQTLSRTRVGASATARRVGLSLTLGFIGGPLISGALAMWAPAPARLPFFIHVALALAAWWALMRAAVPPGMQAQATVSVPFASRRRFLLVIAPAAPWTSIAPALAGAVAPAMLQDDVTQPVLLATVLVATVLGSGALAQAVFPLVERHSRGHHMALGQTLLAGGTLVLAANVALLSVGVAVAAAVLLGLGQGLGLVGGLHAVQRVATPEALQGLTSVFYALGYLGFTAPFVVTAVSRAVPLKVVLVAVALLAVMTALHITVAQRLVPPS